jgi:hypothetical protein
VVCQPWLPYRPSRAVTTGACWLVRRSAAVTGCRGPDWPSPAAGQCVLAGVLPAAGRRAASLSRKRSPPEPALRVSPSRAEPQRRALSQAQAGSRGAEPAHPGAGAAMPARLSGALPRASTRAAAAACSRAGPTPPACPGRNRARPHATWHGRAPSRAMRRPRARAGCGCGECKPRNNSGQYPLIPTGRQAATGYGWPVSGLLPNTLPRTRKLTE